VKNHSRYEKDPLGRLAGTIRWLTVTTFASKKAVATEAGLLALRDGGNAVDAAIAVQMVLTLVEPQSSGIGGGAFLLHYDGKQVEAFDGRETAPAGVDTQLQVASLRGVADLIISFSGATHAAA
jgi:gamma-glutamyltranspeptidase